MQDVNGLLEYELIDYIFYFNNKEYQSDSYQCYDDVGGMVREEMSDIFNSAEPAIEYDSDGIPLGETLEERKIRREIIHGFIQQWRSEHRDSPYIYNDDLHEKIKINQTFLLESVAHSASRYLSTKAILNMEEIMTKAKKIGEVKPKDGNSNQKPFYRMVILSYESESFGRVKMTVGVRLRTLEKVQYSITVPEEGIPFIDKSRQTDNKSKTRKKHHR